MQLAAESELRTGVAAPVRAHRGASRRGGRRAGCCGVHELMRCTDCTDRGASGCRLSSMAMSNVTSADEPPSPPSAETVLRLLRQPPMPRPRRSPRCPRVGGDARRGRGDRSVLRRRRAVARTCATPGSRCWSGADADPWAVETHTANLGGLGYVGDLTDPAELLEQLDGWGIEHVELVAGGRALPAVLPCRPGEAPRADPVRRSPSAGSTGVALEIVHAGRRAPAPDAVLVENVPDLPSWDDGAVLSGFLETLGELGYAVDARILDCYRYGVPQHRSRLILDGLRGGRAMRWPEPTDELVTLRDAIGDLPPVPGGQRAERLPYRARPGAARRSSAGCGADVARDELRHGSTTTSRVPCERTTGRRTRASSRARPTRTCRRTSSDTAPTSSPTSTSGCPGTSSRARSPRTSPRTATGTSIPSSIGRCRSARRRGCRPSRTGSDSPGSRATVRADRQRGPAAARRGGRPRAARLAAAPTAASSGRLAARRASAARLACAASRSIRGDGPAMDPWLVLAAELAPRALSERGARRDASSAAHGRADSPRALLRQRDPVEAPRARRAQRARRPRCSVDGRRGDRRAVRRARSRRGP